MSWIHLLRITVKCRESLCISHEYSFNWEPAPELGQQSEWEEFLSVNLLFVQQIRSPLTQTKPLAVTVTTMAGVGEIFGSFSGWLKLLELIFTFITLIIHRCPRVIINIVQNWFQKTPPVSGGGKSNKSPLWRVTSCINSNKCQIINLF